MAEIRSCKCINEGQDALHGTGNRVFNKTAKDDLRCTVCGATTSGGGSAAKGKKK